MIVIVIEMNDRVERAVVVHQVNRHGVMLRRQHGGGLGDEAVDELARLWDGAALGVVGPLELGSEAKLVDLEGKGERQ